MQYEGMGMEMHEVRLIAQVIPLVRPVVLVSCYARQQRTKLYFVIVISGLYVYCSSVESSLSLRCALVCIGINMNLSVFGRAVSMYTSLPSVQGLRGVQPNVNL